MRLGEATGRVNTDRDMLAELSCRALPLAQELAAGVLNKQGEVGLAAPGRVAGAKLHHAQSRPSRCCNISASGRKRSVGELYGNGTGFL